MRRARITTADEAIAAAAQAIAASDQNLKLAAEYLALAEKKGKSQRQIAEGVGKSVGWVNRLLKWRRGGYATDTPFGPQAAARRVQSTKQTRLSKPDRSTLVKTLGMLGSDHDPEVVNAARAAEKVRKRYELMWGDLIVKARP